MVAALVDRTMRYASDTPRSSSEVKGSSLAARKRPVGDLANEILHEPQLAVAGRVAILIDRKVLAPDERLDASPGERGVCPDDRDERVQAEARTKDGRCQEECALSGRKGVDAGRDQSMQ